MEGWQKEEEEGEEGDLQGFELHLCSNCKTEASFPQLREYGSSALQT